MRKKSYKKIVVAVLSGVLLVGTMAGCGKADKVNAGKGETEQDAEVSSADNGDGPLFSADDPLVIRVALFKDSSINRLYVAKEVGIFDEEFASDNIQVEFSTFTNGPEINEAFIAGQVDVALGMGDQPTLVGISNGSDGKILSVSERQGEAMGIYTGTDSDIESAEDLKGKTLAFQIGTYEHKSVVGCLEDVGIGENDFNMVNSVGSTSESYAGYLKGDIDAWVDSYGATADLVEDGSVKQVASFVNYPLSTYFIVQNSFIEKYPEVTQRLVNVMVETEKWSQDHSDEMYEILSEFSERDINQLKTNLELNDTVQDLTDDDIKMIEYTYNFCRSHDYITNDIDISTAYDDSYIKKARAEIFGE
jgi:sulfonate transport system substrate-binding protein